MNASERTIFLEALEMTDAAQRADFLDRACGGKVELRRRVEGLLEALDQADGFMDSPAVADAATGSGTGPSPAGPRPIREGPGTRIGSYKLLQRVGEGGMGIVFMAEQETPVRRKVALKIIKPGMDSAQVIARFEAERQALALMDHPHIARVLDAGTTDSGRPFFVMELVQGIAITEFCDRNQLTPRERLQLFAPVCQAIQHAHQKGVIHRDIKPSNVLVTLYDGTPVPKVIDFGVAKAIDQRLTEKTLFTQFGMIVGTLEYMSPEQAEMGAPGVDTRSDVYSLGVLLYELLTGSTPLRRAELRQAAYSEVLRKIREEEPPRPSTRLSESTEALPSISDQRKTTPVKLAKLVRGELDWIVMKALEKERARRYETASSLARDIERYLRDEPVEAGPPSATYRLWKLVRRHRATLVTAGACGGLLLAIALGVFLVFLTYRARVMAMREEAVARHMAMALRLDAAAVQAKKTDAESDARAALEFFRANVLAPGRPSGPEGSKGKDPSPRAALDAAESAIGNAFDKRPTVEASIRQMLGESYLDLGELLPAIRQLELAFTLRRQALGLDHADTIHTMSRLADAYFSAGWPDQALPRYVETLMRAKSAMGVEHPETRTLMNNLARAYLASEPAQAEPVAREALAVGMRTAGDDWRTYDAGSLLGGSLLSKKEFAQAEPLLIQGYEGMKARQDKIPARSKNHLAQAGARIIRLYDAWGQKDKATEWRKKVETSKTP